MKKKLDLVDKKKRKKKKPEKLKRFIPIIIALVMMILLTGIAGVMFIYERYSYSKERADLNEYFEIFDESEVAVILQDDRIAERARKLDGTYYMDFDSIQKHFNSRFYLDEKEKLLIYTTPTELIYAPIDTKEVSMAVSGQKTSEDYVIARYEGETLYVALDYVKKYTNFSYTTYENPNYMQVETSWGDILRADVTKDTQIRYQGGVKSEILQDVKAGETVTVLEEMEDWTRVKTASSIIGYVENKKLTNIRTEKQTPVTDYQEPEYTRIKKDYTINLGWHQVTNVSANEYLGDVLAETQALNTISPTWFFLSDNNGNFESIATQAYVDAAHAQGIEVWALFENIAYKDQIDIMEILGYTSKRQYLIQNLVNELLRMNIDGINVDLEEIPMEAGEHYIEFIRELSIACRANQLVLSVDNYVPKEYSAHYNRKEQGIVADYVIIMGYDEHYAGGGIAGSVASINFVSEGIQKTLDEVPADKIINAVPFYTRVWKTSGTTVKASSVGMEAAETFLSQNGVEAMWDETTCQNYAEFEAEGVFYQVWLEDENSMQVRLDLMKSHGLAGVAAWKLGLEKPQIWDLIASYVNTP